MWRSGHRNEFESFSTNNLQVFEQFLQCHSPKKGLNEYLKNFKLDKIAEIKSKSKLSSDTQYGIDIMIPKFKFDYNLNLKND